MDFDDIFNDMDPADQNEDEILTFPNPEGYTLLKDASIFLVDVNINTDGQSVNTVLRVTENFLKAKIISNDTDLFSLILFNFNDENKDIAEENYKVIYSLDTPSANVIKEIKSLQDEVNFPLFNPLSKSLHLNEVFWICQNEFKEISKKAYVRRIFLFTNQDDPFKDDPENRLLAIQKVRDMHDNNIELEIFPLNFSDKFDLKKFYMHVTPKDEHCSEEKMLTTQHSLDKLQDLERRIRQKEFRKRSVGSCPFFMTNGLNLCVSFYSTVQKPKKPKSYLIDSRNNNFLETVVRSYNGEGKELYPNQVGRYLTYGDTKVVFTPEELKKIKTVDLTGMRLMGFKDKRLLKEYNVRHSYFVYPEESFQSGGGQVFDALIKQMTVKDKVAIVKFIPKENCNLRFAALLPQKESYDEDGYQVPPGFNLIFLPFAEDIRKTKEIIGRNNLNYEVKEQEKQAAAQLINKMTFDFDPRAFENKDLQEFFGTVQALALEEDKVEMNFEDEQIKLENEDDYFKEALNFTGDLKLLSKKKTIDVEVPAVEMVAKCVINNKLDMLTYKELQDFCKQHGMKSGGNRTVLEGSVRKFVELRK